MLRKITRSIAELNRHVRPTYPPELLRTVTFAFLMVSAGLLILQIGRKINGDSLTTRSVAQFNKNASKTLGALQPCDRQWTESGLGGNDQSIASFMGVSFLYDRTLATSVKPEIVVAAPLEREGDKPDSVNPRHVLFSFTGPYASKKSSSFFPPMIRIYPIEDFKNALAVSPEDVQAFEAQVEALSSLLGGDQSLIPVSEKIPFLPYGVDASQEFHTHLQRLSFAQGTGIAFLTQYSIEPSLINNEGLFYTFQGLTYDRRFYVTATFPTSASFLPNDYRAQMTENYKLSGVR
jgi:hypothetical protein